MASLKFACGKVTFLASRLCFLQHILALTAVKVLERIDSQKLGPSQVKLKWPNDVLYMNPINHAGQKIGGILVHTFDKGDEIDITLSFGLNIYNSEPTTCVADIVGDKKNFSMESIVADMLNQLEDYTDHLTITSFEELREEYTLRCLQINKLIEDEKHGQVHVIDVNEDGYLVGQRVHDSKTCVVTKIIS